MAVIPKLETFADLEDIFAEVTDYEKETGYRYARKTFDLSRMEALLDRLSRPERSFASILVAGTKGKGSTTATAATLLRTTGASPVGLYTSPHLIHLRERIRLNARIATEEEWLAAARRVVPEALELVSAGRGPTFFELTTAIAFQCYRQEKCEAAAIEVGLGGRLDATNVLPGEKLAATIVTQIGLDHTYLLGKTPAAIALEKAAIARAGVPMIVGAQEPSALAAIEQTARAAGAPLERLGRELEVQVERVSLDGTRFSLTTPRARYRSLETPLVGRYQAENAALAVAAVEHAWLGPLRASGVAATELEDDVRRGLARVRWRGRFDLVRPARGAPVLIDGAHDPTSMKRLVETVREVVPGVRPVLLFAIARDKEIDLILDELAGFPAHAFVCRAKTKRAAEPAELASKLESRGVPSTACEGTSEEALALARSRAGGGLVLVCGSIYLAGEALSALGEDAG
ncbi:bifunctional folylpolyglutamate synthase/dihydrofolate synthase [bacterium]|nr:bifunctional folylpolyglutamate synthase/dihydrofolate synthase [bacterium]